MKPNVIIRALSLTSSIGIEEIASLEFRKMLIKMKTKGTLKHCWQEFEVVQTLENYYEWSSEN